MPTSEDTQTPSPPETIDQLKSRAHGMINQIAKMPAAAKLLKGVIAQCEVFIGYKAGRVVPKGPRKRYSID